MRPFQAKAGGRTGAVYNGRYGLTGIRKMVWGIMKMEDFVVEKGSCTGQVFYLEDQSAGSVPLLKFHLLDQAGIVEHGFTTRAGGVSKGEFASLNLSYTRGDDKAAVDENFRRTAASLHADISDFILTDQTHTTNVRQVTRQDCGKGILHERDYQDVDGLVTDEHGIVLAAFFADCVPLYFVDPVHHAIGLSHSGWRGTVARMGLATIQAMASAYGSKPQDLFCAIGPSICQACYEVSEDVAMQFMDEFPNAGEELCYPSSKGKYQLNLWKANELVLLQAGVRSERLAVTNICTCCNPKLLFSHRASHGKRGNLGAFLKLV